MRPENKSQILLSITRSKAKMYEYSVSEEFHIEIPTDPSKLLTLAIGLLGDYSALTNSDQSDKDMLNELGGNLRFSAQFFDAYLHSRLKENLDPYLLIVGSAAYYLCGLPGSSLILSRSIDKKSLNLNCGELDILLLWLLQQRYTELSDIPDSMFKENIIGISTNLRSYFQTGKEESLFKYSANLRTQAYQTGTPRQLLFADIICAIVKKRFENSAWNCLPKYSDISVEKWSDVLGKSTFMKELWPAQLLMGEKGVYRGKSAIIQMPTSAGKTRATEIIIRSAFIDGRTSLAVIVAPFRALCHEIKNALLMAFHGENVNVDELSDVLQSDFDIKELLGQKQILIITPEKLLYVLRHSPDIAEHIGLLIYDEGHQFDSGTRGITYELLLTSLKAMVPEGIQTILISAVIKNADSIGQWLNGDDFEEVYGTKLIPTYRTVAFTSWKERLGRLEFINPEDPEKGEFWVPRVIDQQELTLGKRERKQRVFPDKNNSPTIAMYLGLKLVANGSVAIFCGTKTTAESICEKIVEDYERGLTLTKPIVFSNQDESNRIAFLCARNLGENATTTQCAKIGIFSHHGNIPQGIRQVVEHAMKNNRIRFVVCTSTLAQGVNLPIRYLIVTSIYQGAEPIKVRDFQNLIGRAGRADQHTEGSIIFADPDIFDERNTDNDGKKRWRHFKQLLNPDNSEPCASSLLSIFEPLYGKDRRTPIIVDTMDMVTAYTQNSLNKFIDGIYSRYSDEIITKIMIESQIEAKVNILASIENYLMSHWDESLTKLDNTSVSQLAKETLAYFLADEEEKEQLVRMFILLERNIEQSVKDASRKKVYGQTMFGVQTSVKIEDWVNKHAEEIINCNENDELLRTLWPIISENINNNTFVKCEPAEILLDLALEWIHGKPFSELFTMMETGNVHIIAGTQRRQPKLESVINICETGFAYEGTLILDAITEILQFIKPQDTGEIIIKLLELQKMLKYGLPTPVSVAIFELGFSDRVVSMDLSSILNDMALDRNSIVRFVKRNQRNVREVLEKYPSYFMERLNSLL